jgi:hypothetical protein
MELKVWHARCCMNIRVKTALLKAGCHRASEFRPGSNAGAAGGDRATGKDLFSTANRSRPATF